MPVLFISIFDNVLFRSSFLAFNVILLDVTFGISLAAHLVDAFLILRKAFAGPVTFEMPFGTVFARTFTVFLIEFSPHDRHLIKTGCRIVAYGIRIPGYEVNYL